MKHAAKLVGGRQSACPCSVSTKASIALTSEVLSATACSHVVASMPSSVSRALVSCALRATCDSMSPFLLLRAAYLREPCDTMSTHAAAPAATSTHTTNSFTLCRLMDHKSTLVCDACIAIAVLQDLHRGRARGREGEHLAPAPLAQRHWWASRTGITHSGPNLALSASIVALMSFSVATVCARLPCSSARSRCNSAMRSSVAASCFSSTSRCC